MAMKEKPTVVYGKDGRHIRPEFADVIVERFLESHAEDN